MSGEPVGRIQPGSRVVFHYSLGVKDGPVAENSFGQEPASVTLGQGQMVAALEACLLGLAAGDRRIFELPPLDAYGMRDPERVQRLPRSGFPEDMPLASGLVVGFEAPTGEEVAGTVLGLEGEEAVVDFSHPFAGHELVFEVEIQSVS